MVTAKKDAEFCVLVRAYAEKAVTLILAGVYGDMAAVQSQDRTTTVKIPATDVYRFDDKLRKQIEDATTNGDVALARRLWSQAKRIEAVS